MSDWPPSPLLWPALLSGALLCGIVASVACLKFRERLAVNVGIDLAALAEAAIAICSGALLWIGFWDFIDSYLVPTAWWSKLCMLLVGALGAAFVVRIWRRRRIRRERGVFTRALEMSVFPLSADGLARGAHQS